MEKIQEKSIENVENGNILPFTTILNGVILAIAKRGYKNSLYGRMEVKSWETE
ncbi:MAG: hypothetical protein IKB01_01225 [Lachnospiraceae bacterium]|nr:hypothetical protein [Lachnospiraceae bacterium]